MSAERRTSEFGFSHASSMMEPGPRVQVEVQEDGTPEYVSVDLTTIGVSATPNPSAALVSDVTGDDDPKV